MRSTLGWTGTCAAATLATLAAVAGHAEDEAKYSVSVPGGLSFSEFKGYESWETIAISRGDRLMAVILGNPVMIEAYKAGVPVNGQPFPDGARMAKIHWTPKPLEAFPTTAVPGELHDVDFMVKDAARFADSGGWGYAAFIYEPSSGTFRPGNSGDQPPQANDAKCGFACHTVAKGRDYVFTEYGKR